MNKEIGADLAGRRVALRFTDKSNIFRNSYFFLLNLTTATVVVG